LQRHLHDCKAESQLVSSPVEAWQVGVAAAFCRAAKPQIPPRGMGCISWYSCWNWKKSKHHWNILVSWATAATAPDESQLNRIIGSIPAPSMFPGCSCSLQRFIRPVTARLSVQILCLDATGCVRFLRCLCTTSRSLTGASHLAEALTLVLGCLF